MSEPALGAMRLFHWSITYLALLFAAVASTRCSSPEVRTAARVLTGVAVAALLIGIGWAFVNRASTDTTTPALLLVVGVVAAVGDGIPGTGRA